MRDERVAPRPCRRAAHGNEDQEPGQAAGGVLARTLDLVRGLQEAHELIELKVQSILGPRGLTLARCRVLQLVEALGHVS